MAAYIDKEVVIKEINNQREFYLSEREGETNLEKLFLLYGSDNALSTMEDIVSDIPTADVVPVVHGKFIELDIDDETKPSKFQCSACLHTEELFMITPEELEWKYCPHCGADMRGKPT